MTASTFEKDNKDNTADTGSDKKGTKGADDFFKAFCMPNVDMDALANSYKKNLEILESINKMSTEVCSGIAQLQSVFVKQMMTELSELIREKGKPSEAVAKFSEFTKEHVAKVVDNGKKISDLLTTTQQSINAAILQRFRESVDEMKQQKKANGK
jgi:phasin family protein